MFSYIIYPSGPKKPANKSLPCNKPGQANTDLTWSCICVWQDPNNRYMAYIRVFLNA